MSHKGYISRRLKTCTILSILFIFFGLASSALALLPADALEHNKKAVGDYDVMVKERSIRCLIPYSMTSYFLDGATEKGISYDLVKRFEKYVNAQEKTKHLKIHMIVIPTERDYLLSNLADGLGDIAIGGLTITDERQVLVDFAEPLLTNVKEVAVTMKDGPDLKNSFDLAGREVYVRKSSSYYGNILKLNEVLLATGKKPVIITLADEHLEDEDLLEMLNAGIVSLLIVDDHKADFWAKIFNNIKVHSNVAVHSEGKIAWAIRKNNPKLKKVINGFVKKNKKGTLQGNMIFTKYLQNIKYMTDPASAKEREHLQDMLQLFKIYAKKYDFNYLMLTALAYQESRLDQSAKSHVGAVGVMQILPSTANDKNVAIKNIMEVEANIHAGTKYLRFLVDRYFADEGITRLNKGLLAFAAYNAGPARVAKLRKEAKEMGLDPNVWFRNVEVVAAKRIGRETVQYVSNIYKYYIAYSLLAKRDKL